MKNTLFNLPAALPKHPAKYTDVLLPQAAKLLAGARHILDPFAGTGRVYLLHHWLPGVQIQGVEIEPEWARRDPRTIVGNALRLPFANQAFDAVFTSPTYGNHMADQSKGSPSDTHHKARTNKYFALLGRTMHAENSGRLHWNRGYQEFHVSAWGEIARVLQTGGQLVLNIKNHIRAGEEQLVTEWHIQTLQQMSFELMDHIRISTPSMRFGRNAEKRVPFESLIRFVKGAPA